MFLTAFVAATLASLMTIALVLLLGNAVIRWNTNKQAKLREQALVELGDGSDVSHQHIIADLLNQPNKS